MFKSSFTSESHYENGTFDIEPLFLVSEVESAIESLKNDKSGGSDGVEGELLKLGGSELASWIQLLFNEILLTGLIPEQWKTSFIVLIHKKGDKTDIQNYRPISLTSTVYKTFSKCLSTRLKPILEFNQPPEQAAFRKGYSTVDHLHTINQVIEKSCEYGITLYLAFIDYTKAFDTIEHNSIWTELKNQGVPGHFIHIIKQLYSDTKAAVKTDKMGQPFCIGRGVKQGCPLSPVLFTAVLEGIFRKLDWSEKGLNIQGKMLSNLRFADDIVVFSTNPDELRTMITELNREGNKIGLQVNRSKTKIMSNGPEVPIYLEDEQLQYVKDFIYLGQVISFNEKEKKDIERRVSNTWNQYWSLNSILKLRLPMETKKEMMDSAILPVLNYSAQTRTNLQKSEHTLRSCQRAMERSLLKVRRSARMRSDNIRNITKIIDVNQQARRLKWDWAGHVFRLNDGRWTSLVTDWTPYGFTRKVGRQNKRWRDELKLFNNNYRWKAQDRKEWRDLGEAFSLS